MRDTALAAAHGKHHQFRSAALTVALSAVPLLASAGPLLAQIAPSWVHRGVTTLVTIAQNSVSAPAANTSVSASTVSVSPSACAGNTVATLVTNALKNFKDPNGNAVSEQVDCSQTFYVTTVTVTGSSYNETYYSFATVPTSTTTNPPSPAHGHAVYYPASGSSPASLLFEPD